MENRLNILSSVARPLVRALMENGYSQEELLHEHGFSSEAFHTPGALAGVNSFNQLWTLGGEVFGARAGLEAGKQIKLIDFQEIGILMTTTRNMAEWLEQAQRYTGLVSDIININVCSDDVGLQATVRHTTPVSQSYERLEFIALTLPYIAEQCLGSPIRLRAVNLTRPKPDDTSPWDEIFGVTVNWGTDVTAVSIGQSEADRTLVTGNEQAKKLFQRMLDSRQKHQISKHPLMRIQVEVTQQLLAGKPTLKSISAALNMSVRSIQRRLLDADTSFNEVLSAARSEIALHHLSQGVAVGEVAHLLGYSDTATFHRAFRRWTGQTPGEYVAGLKL